MRHLAWLSGLLLVISCSVDPVQTVDGSATGGQGSAGGTSGGGGQAGAATGGGGQAGATTGGAGQGGTTSGNGGQAGDQPSGGSGGGPAGAGGGVAGHPGGGQAGHATDGGETCTELETDYGNALATARECTPGAPNQCQHLIGTSLSCPGCNEYVNDVTMLNAIASEWANQGCGSTPTVCPLAACINPGTGACMGNGGPAECQNGVPVPKN